MPSITWTAGAKVVNFPEKTTIYNVCPPMNSRIIDVGGIAAISSGERAIM